MAIKIDRAVLEQACKDIIETILFCLPSAYKGTVYQIGDPPTLVAERITSGIINRDLDAISWGLPEKSDYNPPGKPWAEYMDKTGRPLEAMAWCVWDQKSWTSEDPSNDSRRLPLKIEHQTLDSHHMEPVLVRKQDLYPQNMPMLDYPTNTGGEIIWQKSEYDVVAVIKIHFPRNGVRIGSPETKIIKRLSKALGTDLLSHQLREQSLETMHSLAQNKLESYNILSDSLRNAIAKSGLIFSLIKLELGFLRDQWEAVILRNSKNKINKREAVQALNENLASLSRENDALGKDLFEVQKKFLDLSLPPERGENWVCLQIEKRWNELIRSKTIQEDHEEKVRQDIVRLKKSLYLGKDPDALKACNQLPDDLKREWTDLIYRNTESVDIGLLDRLIHILEDPSLGLPYQEKSRKSLIRLKAVAEIMSQLEKNTNAVLHQVLNGNGVGQNTKTPNKKAKGHSEDLVAKKFRNMV